MTKTEEAGPVTDPFEIWRQLYDTNERTWSAALEQTMASPEFGESSGKLLETMLAAQKAVRDQMRTYLETMNVPTREDIARLGELVIGLEEKIDQVGDRLDAIEEAVRTVPAGPAGRTTPTNAAKPAKAATRAKAAKAAKAATPAKAATRAKAAKPAKAATRARPAKGVKRAKGE